MKPPLYERLRTSLSQGRFDQALTALEGLDPDDAANSLMSIPYEEQQTLFRRLPVGFASKLTASLPYYHAYVLLHSRPHGEMKAIIDAMNPMERMNFFDELPQEAWQRLMDELSAEEAAQETASFAPSQRVEAPAAVLAPAETIIEAQQIEKRFQRPDGGEAQVIAPTDLTIEPGMIIALLGPSGSGKSTLLRILTGLINPSSGQVLWHGRPVSESAPNVAIVFQSFALFPWLTVEENVEVPLLARGMGREERRIRARKMLHSVGLQGFESAYPKELSGA
jgi:ABC-type glutathione transport system ATPase component